MGALLRLCWQRVRQRINEAVRTAGFDDVPEAHLVFFQYPPPDAVRPSDVARRLGMSRQATNYLIVQFEELGYLERRPSSESGRRLIYLTERGWRVVATIHAALRELQEEWAVKVGRQRFSDFMDVLKGLSIEE